MAAPNDLLNVPLPADFTSIKELSSVVPAWQSCNVTVNGILTVFFAYTSNVIPVQCSQI